MKKLIMLFNVATAIFTIREAVKGVKKVINDPEVQEFISEIKAEFGKDAKEEVTDRVMDMPEKVEGKA